MPRSITLSGVREECRDIVFALSVEFYGQVFGKYIAKDLNRYM